MFNNFPVLCVLTRSALFWQSQQSMDLASTGFSARWEMSLPFNMYRSRSRDVVDRIEHSLTSRLILLPLPTTLLASKKSLKK